MLSFILPERAKFPLCVQYYKSFQEYKQAVNDAATMAQGLLSKCQVRGGVHEACSAFSAVVQGSATPLVW